MDASGLGMKVRVALGEVPGPSGVNHDTLDVMQVHVTKTSNGYKVIDATGAPVGAAPTSDVCSEKELRDVLKGFGFTDKAIENAVTEVNNTGDTGLELSPPLKPLA